MAKEVPSLALLLAKKPPTQLLSKEDHSKDLSTSSNDKEQAEDSAVSDILDACKSNDVQSFKHALKDFLEINYPSLQEDSSEEETEPEEEPEEQPGE